MMLGSGEIKKNLQVIVILIGQLRVDHLLENVFISFMNIIITAKFKNQITTEMIFLKEIIS
jgi:hypothetical protein